MVTPAFAQDVQPKVGTTVEETDATAEGDVKTPVEDDVETPTEGDVETPVEDDVETPTEDDVETPVEDGEETSVEDELVVTEDTVTTLSGDQGYTGWKAVDGGWNYYENGVLVTDTFKEIYGITYYFDEWGSMLVGTFDVWDETTGEWHKMYADESGAVLFETGWYYDTEKNNWYYFKEKGILAGEEFVKIGGVDYYFDYAGRMETGSFRVWDENGELAYMMYATESGAVVYETGWYQSSDLLWYYIKEKGILASDEILEIGGAKYYFYFWGDMATGEFWYLDEDGNEVSGFAASNGVIVEENGWIIFGGKWYYMKDGSLCIGSMESVGGNYYYFDYDGVMRTGYFYGEDGYCFADASGAIYTNGWVTDGMLWYYAGPDGYLLTGQWIGDYYVDYTGIMAVGTCNIDGIDYYFNGNGRLVSRASDVAGWQFINGIWYYYNKDLTPYDGWLDNTYFIENGRMLTNCYVWDEENEGYYVGYDGTKVYGWSQNIYGEWIYADPKNNGQLAEGWQVIDGYWYYFDAAWMYFSGVYEIEGVLSEFASNGVWMGYVTGKNAWYECNGLWYYLDENGEIVKDEKRVIYGNTYYFDYWGTMWQDAIFWFDGELVRVNSSGAEIALGTGWIYLDNGEWYYILSDGTPANELTKIGEEYFYFGYDGRMLKGVQQVNGEYKFFDGRGAMCSLGTGWYSSTNYGYTDWYYAIDGAPVKGIQTINGNTYYFNEEGVLSPNLMEAGESGFFLFDENGLLVKSGWAFVYGYWFYVGTDGRVCIGEHVIDGTTRWFNGMGIMAR